FAVDHEIVGDSGAAWPLGYDDFEPWYARAEALLGVAGEDAVDPTEPPRSAPYPYAPGALSDTSRRIAGVATEMGMSPFRLPLAINYTSGNGRVGCIGCTTCDTFACAINAKNDLATTVLPALLEKGLDLRANAVVMRLVTEGARVERVEYLEKHTGQVRSVRAGTVFLSAGALGTPHLLLSSELDSMNPSGHLIGRHLMRHCNAIVFGIFPGRADRRRQFHKQIGIHDFYFGHPRVKAPAGKLG